MSSSVFKLHSDKQFISNSIYEGDVIVHEYKGDPNGFDVIHTKCVSCWCKTSIAVGPSSESAFKALEVWGVTIEGDKLKALAKDLELEDEKGDQTFSLSVNRQGLCLLFIGSEQIMRLGISDRFGWSKYGVEPKLSRSSTVYDMSNGAVLFPPQMATSVRYPDDKKDDDYDNRSINGDEYTSSAVGWKKLVEEKEKEVASLKAALRALIGEK